MYQALSRREARIYMCARVYYYIIKLLYLIFLSFLKTSTPLYISPNWRRPDGEKIHDTLIHLIHWARHMPSGTILRRFAAATSAKKPLTPKKFPLTPLFFPLTPRARSLTRKKKSRSPKETTLFSLLAKGRKSAPRERFRLWFSD